jgi:predicted adenylyl cyclase CyaB
MENIEVEIRSFISKEKYEELLGFFNKNAKKLNEDYQETYYFDSPQDLRIQKNQHYSKVWLKKGKIHDESREEIEIKTRIEDFENLEKLFLALDYKVKIKWFRTRNEFDWNGIKVSVDYTKGYGYIIELEKMCNKIQKEEGLKILKEKMDELKIELTPRKEFENKFNDYKKNWQKLTKD